MMVPRRIIIMTPCVTLMPKILSAAKYGSSKRAKR
jgi:hypothetical protein